jgi:hypothetical protein
MLRPYHVRGGEPRAVAAEALAVHLSRAEYAQRRRPEPAPLDMRDALAHLDLGA